MRRKGGVGVKYRGPRVLTPAGQSRLRETRRESVRSEKGVPSRRHSLERGLLGGRAEIQHSRSLRPRR